MKASTRIRFVAVIACIALVFAIVGCTSGATKMTEADSGKTIQVAKDATFIVELESNPTTGFDWYVDGTLPSQLTTASDDYASSGGQNVVGAGGTRTITYKAVSSGTATLKLVYMQPWQGGSRGQTFELTVTVP